MQHVNKLNVLMNGQSVGILVSKDRGNIYFQYADSFLAHGFNISPFSLKFDNRIQSAQSRVFGGLYGVFNDSLPDGWGLLLMDRELKKRFGWDPHEITPLDRLTYIGSKAMGALEYLPELNSDNDTEILDLAEMAKSAFLVTEGKASDVISQLRIHGGSPGGARPKVIVAMSPDMAECKSGFDTIPEGFEHWIIKFRSKGDPISSGLAEKAYAEMAKCAGLSMPDTDIIKIPNNQDLSNYFAVKRFDRVSQNKLHVVSLGGLAEANHRVPCMDYDGLLDVVGSITKNEKDVEMAFRLMVFNVMTHNKDDHVKNFAFIHQAGHWTLSPSFDLTFSSGMNNEHTTAINGRGNPLIRDIEVVANNHSIHKWSDIVAEVREAISTWGLIASGSGLPDAEISRHEQEFSLIRARLSVT